MKSGIHTSMAGRVLIMLTGAVLSGFITGCGSPYSTVAKIGVKVVGKVVNDADVEERSERLVGRPVAAADTEFGARIRTLEEIGTGRLMCTYPVKDDFLGVFRWAVESERGRIVALAKLQSDPDGGKDIAQKLVLKQIVDGKPPQEVESHKYFQKRLLYLRDLSSKDTIRVYDISMLPDFMGAKFCVMRFDGSNRCCELWIVGVPASSSGSAVNR